VASPLTASEVRCVLSKLAYLTLCRSMQLFVLLAAVTVLRTWRSWCFVTS
jgi:hypothetical protein